MTFDVAAAGRLARSQPAPCWPPSQARPARILTAERVALNFLGHLSGIATATAALVEAVEGTKARIVCTRKTLPGLRILQKYAVRCGGGFNHRFGLDDAVMIKDNHIAAAGGIAPALARRARRPGPYGQDRSGSGHAGAAGRSAGAGRRHHPAGQYDAWTICAAPWRWQKAARCWKPPAMSRLQTVRAIAETGVDYISSGAITHSAPNLDIGLDF